jgi:hypothetical protein
VIIIILHWNNPPIDSLRKVRGSVSDVDHLYIVGAGFSCNAGLPLAADFTTSLLDIRRLKQDAASRPLVEYIRLFVDNVFGEGLHVGSKDWPQLEDLFTSIDLAANTGHNLGPKYSASQLRTIRRALIVRFMRMLVISFDRRKRQPDAAWTTMTEFFRRVPPDSVAFLSMNWDTVIEESLKKEQRIDLVDYGCSAIAAHFKNNVVQKRSIPTQSRSIQILKPHGSVNWMYCDACSRLYWFPVNQIRPIASRLFKESDALEVKQQIGKRPRPPIKPAKCPDCQAQALGTRFATFSYRKALDFSMHHATWKRAEEFLRSARTWIFFGYSMPVADYQFKHLLKHVQLSRPIQPKILIVTKESPSDNTVKNYQRFFGSKAISPSNVLGGGMDSETITRLHRVGALA